MLQNNELSFGIVFWSCTYLQCSNVSVRGDVGSDDVMLDIDIVLRLRGLVQVIDALYGIRLFATSQVIADDALDSVLGRVLHQVVESGAQLDNGAAFWSLGRHAIHGPLPVFVLQVQPCMSH